MFGICTGSPKSQVRFFSHSPKHLVTTCTSRFVAAESHLRCFHYVVNVLMVLDITNARGDDQNCNAHSPKHLLTTCTFRFVAAETQLVCVCVCFRTFQHVLMVLQITNMRVGDQICNAPLCGCSCKFKARRHIKVLDELFEHHWVCQ